MSKKPAQVWIYSRQRGFPYLVRVVQGNAVTELPCENVGITDIKKYTRRIFGKCVFFYVEVFD